jgi:hypothetical protein
MRNGDPLRKENRVAAPAASAWLLTRDAAKWHTLQRARRDAERLGYVAIMPLPTQTLTVG